MEKKAFVHFGYFFPTYLLEVILQVEIDLPAPVKSLLSTGEWTRHLL